MDFDAYSMYSARIQNELKSNMDVQDVKDLIDKLITLNDEKSVKLLLVNKLGIKEDISNLAIAKNILISTNSKEHFFNVTVTEDKKVRSYNFTKGDLS